MARSGSVKGTQVHVLGAKMPETFGHCIDLSDLEKGIILSNSKSVKINFVFFTLGNRKSSSSCMSFVAALT